MNSTYIQTSLTSFEAWMKKKPWQLQEAKSKFSLLVEKAQLEGPQFVTKHGKESVVVLSVEEYEQLQRKADGLKQFFLSAPRIDLDVQRSNESGREVTL